MFEELGQLLICGIEGTTLSHEERQFLEKENIGGVILFSRNYQSPEQLMLLVNEIQKTRKEYPLFISVDNEGGRVFRFKSDFYQPPPMLKVGSIHSPKICFDVHHLMALELKACGINLNYAPVCDIYSNPANTVIGDRAFGNEAKEVGQLITAAIRGLQVHGVMACAKHFPGHGDTLEDSHHELPILHTTLAQLKEREFYPFIKASKARAAFIMQAHVKIPSIDPHYPASLSSIFYQLVREELKHNGLIITDDLEMSAITKYYALEQAGVEAIKAGADIALFRTMKAAASTLELLRTEWKQKTIAKEDIQKKCQRIVTAKKEFLSDYKPCSLKEVRETFAQTSSGPFQQLRDELAK